MENKFDWKDVIEVLTELFSLQDFSVKCYKGKEPFYDQDLKIIHIPIYIDDHFLIMALAHEIMHHKQNMEGRLPDIDSEDSDDYRVALFLGQEDKQYEYLYEEFPYEIEANAFGILFAKKFFDFLSSKNYITINQAKYIIRKLKKSLKFENPSEDRMSVLNEIRIKTKKAYDELEREYGEKITVLLAKRLEIPSSDRVSRIKVS